MPTSSTPSGQNKTPDPARSAAGKKAAATRKRTAAKQAANTAARATAQATDAETRVRATQVRQLAERTLDVPVGVGLVARDSIVSTVRGLATTFGDRTRMEREIARYERRGASARNRFERQVEQTRSSFECGVRERRSHMTKLVGEAQSRIGSIAP